MTCHLRRLLIRLAILLSAAPAHAYEAGWMQIQTAGATPDAPTTTVALYYPTMAAPRVSAMGPFTVDAAIGGEPVDKVKALILLSHGIGGTELGHSSLAQALARNGYPVSYTHLDVYKRQFDDRLLEDPAEHGRVLGCARGEAAIVLLRPDPPAAGR